MISNTVPTPSGRKAIRFTRMEDIRRDLMSGVISVRTSLEEIEGRYGVEPTFLYSAAPGHLAELPPAALSAKLREISLLVAAQHDG